MRLKKPILIDLFCGCGGFSLGASRAGFSVIAGADNDIHAISTHKRNFPKTLHLEVDLSGVSGVEIRNELGLIDTEIDGLIGGPPCQGFSCIGRRDGGDIRNELFLHFFRLVAEIRPRFFLCENVPGILHPRFDGSREAALRQVREYYRLLQPMKLTASDYGAPTTRARVFFFGCRIDDCISINEEDFQPSSDIKTVNVEQALRGLPRSVRPQWQTEGKGWRKVRIVSDGAFGERLNGVIPQDVGDVECIRRLREERLVSGCLGTKHTEDVIRRFRRLSPGSRDTISKSCRLDPKGFCPTLRAGTDSERGSYQAVRPIHPTEDRVITPREAARLQGFPDWFQFHATKWHSFRLIGSSVSPILAEGLLRTIRGRLSESGRSSWRTSNGRET